MGITVHRGDITKLAVDAIVNAANEPARRAGLTARYIGRRKELLEECRTLNGSKTGQAKITGGYRLRQSM
jgi:O-acetyl-ADP-ribose deacetylase (regulator of RNase III)